MRKRKPWWIASGRRWQKSLVWIKAKGTTLLLSTTYLAQAKHLFQLGTQSIARPAGGDISGISGQSPKVGKGKKLNRGPGRAAACGDTWRISHFPRRERP